MDGDNNANNNANNNVNPNAQGTTGQQNNNANQPNNNSNGIDYNKIQEMIDGRNAKTEDSVLKSYFQKQGLSQEEIESAINTFKTQKANQANAQNKELTDAQASLSAQLFRSAIFNRYGIVLISTLSSSTKSYAFFSILNLWFSNCADKDGNVLEDTLKTALQKVIDDVPGLKKQVQGTVGITVGADTNNGTNSNNGVFDFGFTGVRPKKQN